MESPSAALRSPQLADVLTATVFGDRTAAVDFLIEIPHGATERQHFDALGGRLRGPLPAELEAFFHVNTDVGAPELGVAIARELAVGGLTTLVIRCLVPRTFVDTNRVLDAAAPGGMTSGVPTYVTHDADRELLVEVHGRYCAAVEHAFTAVCGGGGLALALHTYAPRSVDVAVDADIVTSLRHAYRSDVYPTWPLRPEVDLITAAPEPGGELAPAGLPEAVAAELGASGVTSARNASYQLHPATQGYRFSARHPGRVLCIEARRDLLGSPWQPFAPTRVGPRKTARLARPIARAIHRHLSAR
jgi:hypothetical protein